MSNSPIRVSGITPIAQAVTIKSLGKLFSAAYVSFEFSNNGSFKKSDLVIPTGGRLKIEGSEQGVYWGTAATSNNDGTVTFTSDTGDYERVSMDGCIDEIRISPVDGHALVGATHYRVIILRA